MVSGSEQAYQDAFSMKRDVDSVYYEDCEKVNLFVLWRAIFVVECLLQPTVVGGWGELGRGWRQDEGSSSQGGCVGGGGSGEALCVNWRASNSRCRAAIPTQSSMICAT